MGMSVIPEEARRVISGYVDRVMQNLARHGHHSEHVVLRRIRRDRQPMKVQIRHIHAGIHGASLWRPRWQIVDIGNSENVPRGGADYGSHRSIVESEGIPAILIYCVQRQGYYVILRLHLRRLRRFNSLGNAHGSENHLGSNEGNRSRHNRDHSARCQLESSKSPLIFGATVFVSGPRSFSYTTPLLVTRNVMTPEDRYFAGYAISATRPVSLPACKLFPWQRCEVLSGSASAVLLPV